MPQTVLVTGSTGYIAKHIVLQLLNGGYTVVGSLRSPAREDELRAAIAPHLDDPAALERLRIVVLDLTSDSGWDAAMEGVDVLMHTASPFPLAQPKDENDLIRPAVDGALRAVQAAQRAGVRRVIMTSSTVAIMTGDLPADQTVFDETNWSDMTHPSATPYAKSKTMAEQVVWDWNRDQQPDMQITMINPSFVQGPPLDAHFGSSIGLIERLMRGKDPMLPRVGFPCVDVRDVALMHIRAMQRPESIAKRFIGADRFIWLADMGALLKTDHPQRKIPTRTAPDFLVRILALFDGEIRSTLPVLGHRIEVTADAARQVLGLEFRDTRDSIRESATFLADNDLI